MAKKRKTATLVRENAKRNVHGDDTHKESKIAAARELRKLPVLPKAPQLEPSRQLLPDVTYD